jgi:hypothetical protein
MKSQILGAWGGGSSYMGGRGGELHFDASPGQKKRYQEDPISKK